MRFPRPTGTTVVMALVVSTVLVPTTVVAPTFGATAPQPHPVSPHVQRVALTGVDARALRATDVTGRGDDPARSPVVLTPPMTTDEYRMLGISWRGAGPGHGAVVVSARTRTDGSWTDWFDVPVSPDTGGEPSPNGRFGAEPYWVGDSDGVQVRIDAVGSARPTDVRADLIEPGTSAADAAVTGSSFGSRVSASTNRPPIVTRSQWGADESLRDKHLENTATVKVAFVHHTAGSNSYTRNESPAVVRGLYSYYVNTLGYADMGYNFLVDKFGTIYEGRAGSITKSVRSAATGGFNTNSMAIVAMGNFQTARATDALVSGIAKVAAYRLSRFFRDPFGRNTLTAEVGSSRYSAGTRVSFRVISGHRDAGYTACPGDHLYRRLPDIRRLAGRYMGSSLIEPSVSRRSVPLGHDVDITVRSGVTQHQRWTLTVRQRCGGEVVRRISGTAGPARPIVARWNGRDDDGAPVAAGRYRLTLTSSGDGTSAWPFRATVATRVGGAAEPATTSALPARSGTYVPLRPHALMSTSTGLGVGRPLTLGAGRRVDVPVLGRAGVPTSGVAAVALSVEASCASRGTSVFVGPASVTGSGSRAVTVGANSTARGFALARVGPDGAIRFQNQRGLVSLRASVVGYVSTDGHGGSLLPLRRSGIPGATPLRLTGTPTSLDVTGRAGVPDDARAVLLVVRRDSTSDVGAVWAWADGTKRPAIPAWQRARGVPSVGAVLVPLRAAGRLRLAADRPGAVSLQVGGYVAGDVGDQFHPVVPHRLLGDGTHLARGDTRIVDVSGRAGVPRDAQAILVSVTGSSSHRGARLALWPRGGAEPATADLAVPKGRTSESVVLVRLGRKGDVRLGARGAALHGNLTLLGWSR